MRKMFFLVAVVLLNVAVSAQWVVTDYNGIDSLGSRYSGSKLNFFFHTYLTTGQAAVTYEKMFNTTKILQNDALQVSCRLTGGSAHCFIQLYNNLNPSVATNIVTLTETGHSDVYTFTLPSGTIYLNRMRIQFGYFPYETGTRNIYIDWIKSSNGVILEDPTTSAVGDDLVAAKSFKLQQNYPNPFNPATKISVNLGVSEKLNVRVYNTLGQLVNTIASGNFTAGTHTFEFNASNLPSGLYICQASTSTSSQIIKMTLLK